MLRLRGSHFANICVAPRTEEIQIETSLVLISCLDVACDVSWSTCCETVQNKEKASYFDENIVETPSLEVVVPCKKSKAKVDSSMRTYGYAQKKMIMFAFSCLSDSFLIACKAIAFRGSSFQLCVLTEPLLSVSLLPLRWSGGGRTQGPIANRLNLCDHLHQVHA